jgi:hypothetical protein
MFPLPTIGARFAQRAPSMKDHVNKRLLWIATWCTGAVALVATINVSCGTVQVRDACAQACPDIAMLESRLAELEERITLPSAGVVGVGSVIAHTTHMPGSASLDEMREAGFAVCDGSTPESQGITGAVLTGPTPDLGGRFLRGNAISGELQNDATAANGLSAIVNQSPHTHTQAPHGHAVSGGAHTHGLNAHTHGMDHTHLSRISDSNGFCNPNAVQGSQGDLTNTTDWQRATGTGCHYATSGSRQVSSPLGGRSITDPSTGNTAVSTPSFSIDSTAAANNPAMVSLSVSLMSASDETRPANMSVVWMMRVR